MDYGPNGDWGADGPGVPTAAWKALKEKLSVGCNPGEFPSVSAALESAALAVGEWLAKQAAPPAPGEHCGACHGSGNGGLISSEGHGAAGRSVFAKCRACAGAGVAPATEGA